LIDQRKQEKGVLNAINNIIPCSECQAGQMHRHFVTYYTWLGEELITVPDFPAWICDVCGRREYDPRALNHLSLLLSPNAGSSSRRRKHIHLPQTSKKNTRLRPS
jgi:YgiT-type zinc finger domain-containing protein